MEENTNVPVPAEAGTPEPPKDDKTKEGLLKRTGRKIKETAKAIRDNPVVLAIGSVIGAIGTVAVGAAINALTGGKEEAQEEEPVETDFVETNDTPEE